jgi:two-component system, OmpR family, sensor histidine kinase PhoQ
MALVRSLRARVLLWVSVALTLLFALTIVGLDLTFRQSTARALEELLDAQMLGLIALAEPDGAGELMLPAEQLNPRFEVAESGLYGFLWDRDGRVLWQSLSLLGQSLDLAELPPSGARRQLTVTPPARAPLEALLMGITWEFDDGRVGEYTLGIAVSLEPYIARQRAFRMNLIGWFAGITLTMLLVITGLLRWVLRPLRTLERQVREVEAGDRAQLTGDYPTELVGLADDLNALIDTERRRQVRYRNTLDDLAHSLKTPLAVMRSLLSEGGAGPRSGELNRELDRMDQRVSYQLRRARASGATGLGMEPVPVAPLVQDLRDGLNKVYRDKHVSCDTNVSATAVFHGDSGDLTELLGNLVDNAYKYCRSRVAVEVSGRDGRLRIAVDDDGPGISATEVDQLLERGYRADESVPGQGIGLAVVRETVELYQGELRVERSRLGGARVFVELGRAGTL